MPGRKIIFTYLLTYSLIRANSGIRAFNASKDLTVATAFPDMAATITLIEAPDMRKATVVFAVDTIAIPLLSIEGSFLVIASSVALRYLPGFRCLTVRHGKGK